MEKDGSTGEDNAMKNQRRTFNSCADGDQSEEDISKEYVAFEKAEGMKRSPALQELVGMTSNKAREKYLEHLLPRPLYLLYINTDALPRVQDERISVSILSEEEESKQFKMEEGVSLHSTSVSDSDQDISMTGGSVKYQRQSLRDSDIRTNKQKQLLASHPLYVHIEICMENEKEFALILDFYCIIKLHVITVKCEVITPDSYKDQSTGEVLSKENILKELFPDDAGKDSPNPLNYYQLQQVGLTDFQWLMDVPSSATYSAIGRPYFWAQRICGIDFIADSLGLEQPAPAQVSKTNVESVMNVLTRKFRSRILLAKQMKDLEKNVVPAVSEVYPVPSKLSSRLTEWRCISWLDYRAQPSTESLIKNDLVSPNDMFYKCTISCKADTLIAYIAIKNKFPEEISIFTILLNGEYDSINCNEVRDIERAVNTDWPDEYNIHFKTWLFSAQIWLTMAYLDIYTEMTELEQYENDEELKGEPDLTLPNI